MDNQIIFIPIADERDTRYVPEIMAETERSASARGAGIAKSTVAAVEEKILRGKAAVALKTPNGFKTKGYSLNLDYAWISNTVISLEAKANDSKDKIFARDAAGGECYATLTAGIAISF